MVKRSFAIVLALLLCLSAFPASAQSAVPREITPLTDEEIPATLPGQHHYLLACTDSWDGGGSMGNTDGLILVTLDTAAKRIIFNTLTREMLIHRPDGGIGRITYIARNYGVDALKQIVETHFGVRIENYAVFCMNNIQDIIDAMGGVTITVTDAEAAYLNRYRIARDATTPSMEKAGTYLFTGHAAVIYMRIRKVGNDGDAGRTRRIRTVLSTLTAQNDQISLDEALKLLDKVSQSLITTDMTMQDMLQAVSYAMELRGVSPEGYQIPPQAALEDIYYAGMATRQVDFPYTRDYLQKILTGDESVVQR